MRFLKVLLPVSVFFLCLYGCASMSEAVVSNDIETVASMIKSGSDVNQADEDDYTPLMYAVAFGNGEMVDMLLAAGADPNLRNNLGSTSLLISAMTETKSEPTPRIASALVKYRARVNDEDKAGYTPLDYAVLNENFEFVRFLLESGADVDKNAENLVERLKKDAYTSLLAKYKKR